jgi:hypothetical protein
MSKTGEMEQHQAVDCLLARDASWDWISLRVAESYTSQDLRFWLQNGVTAIVMNTVMMLHVVGQFNQVGAIAEQQALAQLLAIESWDWLALKIHASEQPVSHRFWLTYGTVLGTLILLYFLQRR